MQPTGVPEGKYRTHTLDFSREAWGLVPVGQGCSESLMHRNFWSCSLAGRDLASAGSRDGAAVYWDVVVKSGVAGVFCGPSSEVLMIATMMSRVLGPDDQACLTLPSTPLGGFPGASLLPLGFR